MCYTHIVIDSELSTLAEMGQAKLEGNAITEQINPN